VHYNIALAFAHNSVMLVTFRTTFVGSKLFVKRSNIFVALLCAFCDVKLLITYLQDTEEQLVCNFIEMFVFQAELELLMMDEDTERNHFSLKSIQAQEVEGKKSHKRKYKKKLIEEESIKDDGFEVILLL
jgi:hypothetical protein